MCQPVFFFGRERAFFSPEACPGREFVTLRLGLTSSMKTSILSDDRTRHLQTVSAGFSILYLRFMYLFFGWARKVRLKRRGRALSIHNIAVTKYYKRSPLSCQTCHKEAKRV